MHVLLLDSRWVLGSLGLILIRSFFTPVLSSGMSVGGKCSCYEILEQNRRLYLAVISGLEYHPKESYSTEISNFRFSFTLCFGFAGSHELSSRRQVILQGPVSVRAHGLYPRTKIELSELTLKLAEATTYVSSVQPKLDQLALNQVVLVRQ